MGVIHCVTEPELCQFFKLEGFPTIKFIPPNSQGIESAQTKKLKNVDELLAYSKEMIVKHFDIPENKLIVLGMYVFICTLYKS